MKTQQDLTHVKDLLHEAIEILAKASKDNNVVGQWHDSILSSLTFSRRARESLEGIGIELDHKMEGGD